jgi:hypothetical protein
MYECMRRSARCECCCSTRLWVRESVGSTAPAQHKSSKKSCAVPHTTVPVALHCRGATAGHQRSVRRAPLLHDLLLSSLLLVCMVNEHSHVMHVYFFFFLETVSVSHATSAILLFELSV